MWEEVSYLDENHQYRQFEQEMGEERIIVGTDLYITQVDTLLIYKDGNFVEYRFRDGELVHHRVRSANRDVTPRARILELPAKYHPALRALSSTYRSLSTSLETVVDTVSDKVAVP